MVAIFPKVNGTTSQMSLNTGTYSLTLPDLNLVKPFAAPFSDQIKRPTPVTAYSKVDQ